MREFDVVALGELLVDFSNKGMSENGNYIFEANPGGAPCNVLSMLQKLDKSTAFIGKVGQDFLGDFLCRVLQEQGIDVANLSRDPKVPTTLAFVSNTPDGDRSFSFYRNPGADMMLRKKDVDCSILENAKIFHFGTLSMTDDEIAKVTKSMVSLAKEKGLMISFDPNLRPPLWADLEQAKVMMDYGMRECDILKISDNEVEFITGMKLEDGILEIRKKYQPKLLCVTMGKEGSVALYKDMVVRCDAFLQNHTVDTTGAGDTFMACVLNAVLENGLDCFEEKSLKDMLLFANAAASIITTRTGALKVMPKREEVEHFMAVRKDCAGQPD